MGANFLPSIINSVIHADKNFKFIIIGENKNDYIYKKLKEINSKYIKILNPVSNDQIYSYFRKSDLLIFLTRVGVGVGLIIF